MNSEAELIIDAISDWKSNDGWEFADREAAWKFFFQAGAASRDAEVARLKTVPMRYRRMAFNAQLQDELARLEEERDQLRAQINLLISAIKVVEIDSEEVLDFDECTAMCVPMDAYHGLVEAAEATPEQSLFEYRNKVIEECAAVLNVAITRLSSCGASIKNDVAISTLKEQSCRLRAMKEQP